MVQLSIRIRTKPSYAKAGKIKAVTVDSSQRVEEIVDQGSLLYSDGKELPLNSSFASNNVQDGDILESCSSPLLSSLLSAVLQDLNSIEEIPEDERTQVRIQPLLGGLVLDPWPTRWSFDSMKTRKICLAMMKQVLQRDGRFNLQQVPKLTTLQELYDFMQQVWTTGNRGRRGHNSMMHVFKPSAKNADGRPSTCWQLMDHKYQQAHQLRMSTDPTMDWIEEFVRLENSRHDRVIETPQSTAAVRRKNSASKATPRKGRRLQLSPVARRTTATTTPCTSVSCNQLAECTCLDENCPFFQSLCCPLCFIGNHPPHLRNHPRVDLSDPRLKSILKAHNKPEYCPEYQSGPYAILCTLLEASEGGQSGHARREFSLSESRLKRIAQTRCRSNLYDRQARGRSAFACIQNLIDKQLVRKELIPGREEARFSLMREGEAMAKRCLAFERSLAEALKETTSDMMKQPYNKHGVSLIVDSREDATYAKRLIERCQDRGVSCEKRELPAGDYLFITESSGGEELVLPLVVERKSWSDLADSVSDAGKGHRRLGCVRVGGYGNCSTGRCQLCRMKASGCSKVMFVIEGARCLNRDREEKCNDAKRCRYCKETSERHNLIHKDLEEILYQLQANHGCLIHFTRGYNETIESLEIMHRILVSQSGAIRGMEDDSDMERAIQASLGGNGIPTRQRERQALSYKQFCQNIRQSRSAEGMQPFGAKRGRVHGICTEAFIRGIRDDNVLSIFSTNDTAKAIATGYENLDLEFSATTKTGQDEVEVLEIDSEDEESNNGSQEIYVLEGENGWTPAKASTNQPIEIEIDDNGEKTAANKTSDDVVVVLEDYTGVRRDRARGDNKTVPIFIITGLYDYDTDYYHDVNKIWQSSFRNDASKSRSNTKESVLHQIRSIQSNDVPLVQRSSILYWALQIQLCHRTLLHTARDSDSFSQLSHYWNHGGLDCDSTGDLSVQDGTRSHSTPQRKSRRQTRQQASSKKPAVLTVDDDIRHSTVAAHRQAQRRTSHQASRIAPSVYTIDDAAEPPCTVKQKSRGSTIRTPQQQKGAQATAVFTIDDDAVSVSHSARRTVAEEKSLRRGQKRASPKVAPEDTSIDGKESDLNNAARAPAGGQRKPSPRKRPRASSSDSGTPASSKAVRPASKTDADIREARLRRFGDTNSVQLDQWSCDYCTGTNGASNSRCIVCQKQRVWTCDKCTVENTYEATTCAVCGCVKKTVTPISDASAAGYATRPPNSPDRRGVPTTSLPPRHPRSLVISRERSGGMAQATELSPWSCRSCTYENKISLARCEICDRMNPSFGTTSSLPGSRQGGVIGGPSAEPTSRGSSSFRRGEGGVAVGRSTPTKHILPDDVKSAPDRPRSRIRCGACGNEGHNRGTGEKMLLNNQFCHSVYFATLFLMHIMGMLSTATAATCTAYYDEHEVQLRAKKRETAEAKAEEARVEAARLRHEVENGETTRERRMAELQRLLAQQEQDNEQTRKLARSELRRRQKAAERAERRARKLGG
eukprot:scaffold831_cov109-Cylindrotheca_fusiformis.AAC.2